jgi:hypothetical protein
MFVFSPLAGSRSYHTEEKMKNPPWWHEPQWRPVDHQETKENTNDAKAE